MNWLIQQLFEKSLSVWECVYILSIGCLMYVNHWYFFILLPAWAVQQIGGVYLEAIKRRNKDEN